MFVYVLFYSDYSREAFAEAHQVGRQIYGKKFLKLCIDSNRQLINLSSKTYF